MKRSWLYSLIVVLGACSCSASATEASLILVNGKLWTENPPGFGPWGFNSPSRHHDLSLRNSSL